MVVERHNTTCRYNNDVKPEYITNVLQHYVITLQYFYFYSTWLLLGIDEYDTVELFEW